MMRAEQPVWMMQRQDLLIWEAAWLLWVVIQHGIEWDEGQDVITKILQFPKVAQTVSMEYSMKDDQRDTCQGLLNL
jgi:hypothetical protein